MPGSRAVVTLAALLLAAACGSGDDDGSSASTTTSTSPAPPLAPSTTAADTTSTAVPGTTAPVLTVVIDPGHNGANGAHPEIINRPVDAGGFEKACNTTGAATDGGVTESAINWAVAQALRDRLEAAGIGVILTRDSDDGAGPCIDERGRTAADAGADLLISIHADGAPASAHGFHVIHPAVRAGYTEATAAPSASAAADVREALALAGFVPSTYVGENGLDERDDLGTLNRAGVPAVMVEMGNLRHSGDAATLTDPAGQARVADALAAGVTQALARTAG